MSEYIRSTNKQIEQLTPSSALSVTATSSSSSTSTTISLSSNQQQPNNLVLLLQPTKNHKNNLDTFHKSFYNLNKNPSPTTVIQHTKRITVSKVLIMDDNNDNNNGADADNGDNVIIDTKISENITLKNKSMDIPEPDEDQVDKVSDNCQVQDSIGDNINKDEKLIEIVSSELDPPETSHDNANNKDDNNATLQRNDSEQSASSSSIAAQFNQIVRLRKTTVPRCRRSALPSKTSSPRYMTQPVMSENPNSIIDSSGFMDPSNDEIGSTTSIGSNLNNNQDILNNASGIDKYLPARYARTLSGTTKIKRDLPSTNYDQFDPVALLTRKKEGSDVDNKSDRSLGSQDIPVSPDTTNSNSANATNQNSSIFFDENNKQRLTSKSLLDSAGVGKSSQNSLPGSLRRNVPHHIRIHSDEIKPIGTVASGSGGETSSIADVTSDYLNRKISKTSSSGSEKTNKDIDFSVLTSSVAGASSNRISPFRYTGNDLVASPSPYDSVVLKSPSAQALMKSNLARSRGLQTKQQTQQQQMQQETNSSKENLEETEQKFSEFDDNAETNSLEKSAEIASEPQLSSSQNDKLEKRYLIIQELIHVESEYVKVLEMLVNHYMVPMKLEKIIDDTQVDTIFNKIPDLLYYHNTFFGTLTNYEFDETIGDKMSEMFSRMSVQDCYASFIENFSVSEKLLESSLSSKSTLQKFLELKQKEAKNKLPLKALLVQPVQRIPRYELLIKRLIEYTSQDSPDYDYLLDAQSSIHQLALKINAVKESTQDESLSEGIKFLHRLLSPMSLNSNRQFIRHDPVTVEDRKEGYTIFLFSDQIILTSIKRRGAPTNKKPPVLRLMTPSGLDFIENVKYKIISRINIENIEFETSEDTDQKIFLRNKEMRDKKDLSLLEEIEMLVCKMDRKHSEIDSSIKKMYMTIIQEMEEAKNSKLLTPSGNSSSTSFIVTSKEGLERMDFTFSSAEKKHSWEKTVLELKNKLVDVPRTPKFLQSLSVTRTQSGMQFCCASPIEGFNNSGIRDIWICQSDGFTGHLCLLSMQSEHPIITLNSPIPGCNSKVTCIIAVPGYNGTVRRSSLSLENRLVGSLLGTSGGSVTGLLGNTKKRSKNDSITALEVPKEDAESEVNAQQIAADIVEYKMSQQQQHEESSSPSSSDTDNEDLDEGGAADESTQKAKKMNDPYKATIWIGLEDGVVLVFYSAENIRVTKSKRKLELGSPILSMLHFDNHVYVSLQNGEIVTFKRHIEGYWDFDYPSITKLTNQTQPIKNLLAVTGFIWGTSGRNIIIINPTSVKIENTFSVSEGSDQRAISLIACSGQCVWVTQENSSRILLYHATSYEFLYEINIRPNVLQNLQVWDDIIIRHKEACLRITCLLVCKDLLWVGTSSGLILTVMIPNVTTSTTKSSIFQIKVETLDKGHTGPVRFLVGLESSLKPQHHSLRRQSLSPITTMATQMKVICGGEGSEDFAAFMNTKHHSNNSNNSNTGFNTNNNNSSNQSAYANNQSSNNNSELGRDDATNHILVWDVQ